MATIVGIDLGTTTSAIAVIRHGKPVVLPNAEGERLTPSVVSFAPDGTYLVGTPARRRAITHPEETVFSVKRLMGRRFDDPLVQADLDTLPYEVVEGPGGDAWVHIGGRRYSPAEISALILQKLVLDAEAYLGEAVRQAVITVPAYFNDKQIQATADAGRIAGLNVLRIINEPTAAALAFGLDRRKDERVVVLSIGGGSTDVSLLELGEGVFAVKATRGDTHLGGNDLDRCIVDMLTAEFLAQTGIHLTRNASALQRLWIAAEQAKIDLSAMFETEIDLPYIAADNRGPRHIHTTLTRQQFGALASPILARIEGPLNGVLQDAGVRPDQIDDVVLVGGQTRTPMVSESVEKVMHKTPRRGIDPDEAVAIGAATQAGVLSGMVRDVLLLDVYPFDLCIETAIVSSRRRTFDPRVNTLPGVSEARFAPSKVIDAARLKNDVVTVVYANATAPTARRILFTTERDEQTAAVIHLVQRLGAVGAEFWSLGYLTLQGMPPEPRGLAEIEVTLDLDVNSAVTLSARVRDSNIKSRLFAQPPIRFSTEKASGSAQPSTSMSDLVEDGLDFRAGNLCIVTGARLHPPLPSTATSEHIATRQNSVDHMHRVLATLIEANTTIPTQYSVTFTSDRDGQTDAVVHLMQARNADTSDLLTLGHITFEGITPQPRGHATIEVTLDIDANRVLSLKAEDNTTHHSERLTVRGPSSWTSEELKRMAGEAESRAQRERELRHELATREAAALQANAAEKTLREIRVPISADLHAHVERAVADLRAATAGPDLAAIEGLRQALTESVNALATEVYERSSATPTSPTELHARVFVSHSHVDYEYCRAFVQALRNAQVDVWYDEDDLPLGELTPKIEAELMSRSILIPILSPEALRSQWVLKEVQRFRELYLRDPRRVILPVLARAIEGEAAIWDILRDFKRIEGDQMRPLAPETAAQLAVQALAKTIEPAS